MIQRNLLSQRITLLGAFTNIILAAAKIYGGMIGMSQALIADGIHSLADLVTDFVVLFATRFSNQKADARYQYGYARIETLATAVLALLLIITGLSIIYDAGKILFDNLPGKTPQTFVLYIAFFSLLIKELLFRYTLHFAKKLESSLLHANAWHHRSDAASSLIVLVGIVGSMLGFDHFDALASVVVAIMIIKMGWELTSNSVRELIDIGLDRKTLETIQQITLDTAGVRAIHQLRTRSMGGQIFLDMHLLVSPYLSVSEGHYIAAKVHRELMANVPSISDTTIHVDPEDDEEGDIASSVLDLPPRHKLIPILKKHWGDLISPENYKDIILDYLHGKISIIIRLPFNHAAIKNSDRLLESLQEKISELSYIDKLTLSFNLSRHQHKETP